MNNITLKTIALSAILSAASLTGNAQEQPRLFGKTISSADINPNNGKIRCATTQYEQYLQEKYPGRQTTEQFEQWIAPKVQEAVARRMASPDAVAVVVTIPVVVHVIHNGDAIGSGENIADAQVLSQIQVLNQDYRRMAGTPGFNANPVGADMEIQFAMAKVDPNGNPTTGIDRVNLTRTSWNTEAAVEEILKPQTSWDPTKYLNIWVCRFGGNQITGLGGTLGYAQFPGSSGLAGLPPAESSETDGVILNYDCFGSQLIYPQGSYDTTYNQGRTLTHELGHFFGLRHINGDNDDSSSCNVNATDSTRDFCPDTPPVQYLSYECIPNDSCTNVPGLDMIENYMDYTPDYCMNIFTKNQKGRMLAVLQNSPNRASLTTSNVWMATESFAALTGVSLYPNPATDVLNISVPNGKLPDSYTVYNSLGQTVANTKVSTEANLAIGTSSYSNGIYFIKIDKGNQSTTLKFVKN
jgi:hypothetical protein